MLRMADGPVANLPVGMDAYGGYVNRSGIGITYPQVVAKFPNQRHLSITTDGASAMCADVESGAMSDWTGYRYGYCAVSNANALIERYGRPPKLWLAHYDPAIGAHICSPECWPGLVTTADGTQWTNHGSADWDESLLADDFFGSPAPPVPSIAPLDPLMEVIVSLASSPTDALNFVIRDAWATYRTDPLTVEALEYLHSGYSGPWAGSIDKVLATIIDTATTSGHLRPMFAGAA